MKRSILYSEENDRCHICLKGFMNISLLSLTLLSQTTLSPFMTLYSSYGSNKYCFQIIHANLIFSHFIHSKYFDEILVKDSSFSYFLSNPIHLVSANDFTGVKNSKRIVKSGKKNITCTSCTFSNCNSISNSFGSSSYDADDHGGAILTSGCNTYICFCIFTNNKATFSGSVEIQDSPIGIVNDSLITKSYAQRFGAMMLDGHEHTNIGSIYRTNITMNKAEKWIGGVRTQHNGGVVKDSNFVKNHANSYGAFWDYSHKTSTRELDHIYFVNNTADEIGAGFTSYHLLFQGEAKYCVFYGNRNLNDFGGRSILVHSDTALLKVMNCVFEGKKDIEMLAYFDTSKIIETEENYFNGENMDMNNIEELLT
ncbi:hypothetical protein TRFO_21483 [Tritrichomonas foetus]|uniref:Right handed beta helix domain-containing protein n=1 Tax=Tritrichomonas foetus TaxID=1144522 RepID=A0A1J4KEG8_9EUKA|nr:hypothetical protein TRFO_21483 [Tritrichomonas foetus]|eukprot:OHT09595.1 hypothetical protein TRFO_21483 [Tritrichomonas foetus]